MVGGIIYRFGLQKRKVMRSVLNQEFGCGQIKFELSISHVRGAVEWTADMHIWSFGKRPRLEIGI